MTFSAPVNLSNGPSWAVSDYPWPVEAPNGMVVVGWEDNTAGGSFDAVLQASTDGGATFGGLINLSNNPESTSTEVGHALRRRRHALCGMGRLRGLGRRPDDAPLGRPRPGDVPVPADYDGDGRADIAVFRGSSGEWLIAAGAGECPDQSIVRYRRRSRRRADNRRIPSSSARRSAEQRVIRVKGLSTFRARIFWSIIPVVLSLLVVHAVMDVTEHKRLMTGEFTKRGEALTASLAETSELGVLTEDPQNLDASMRGVVGNPDVVHVVVYGERGKVLARWSKQGNGPGSWELPAGLEPRLYGEQKPTTRSLLERPGRVIEFFAPVFSEEAKTPDETLLGSGKGAGPSQAPRRRPVGAVRLGMSLEQLDAHVWAIMELWTGVAVAFVAISTAAVYYSSRRITRPIRQLTEYADRMAQGFLDQVIPVTSRDEIGQLAATFNKMARALKGNIDEKEGILAELRDLNQTLEDRIRQRTGELQERTEALQHSLEEVRAMGEVSRAVSSSLDIRQVLDTVASYAVRLSGADACGIFEVDTERNTVVIVAARNLSKRFVDALQDPAVDLQESIVARSGDRREARQIPDVARHRGFAFRETILQEGFRALLSIPMGSGGLVRGLVLYRRQPGTFDSRVVNLLTTFANQSKVAIDNARLFKEIQSQRVQLEKKGRQLEIANRHKSEFLAAMSHELRTPLNAIIGYSEMLLEETGDLGENRFEADLQKINVAGRHLLELINGVLDLSKIEAGKMELYLEVFDLAPLVRDIGTVIQPLAEKNGNRLEIACDGQVGSMRADRVLGLKPEGED